MDARALHLLHDARDQEVFAIADGVDFALGAQKVLIQQDRVVHVHMLGDDAHVLNDIRLGVGDDHVLAAQNVGGAHQHRVAQISSAAASASSRCENGAARRHGGSRNAPAARQSVRGPRPRRWRPPGCPECGRPISSRCLVSLMAVWPPNWTTQAIRLFGGDDVVHALRVERVEIQAVAGIKVGGDGLGVVVDQDGLTAVLFQRPDAVDRAVVELDALADADGTGTKDQHFLLLGLAICSGLGLFFGNELSGFVLARHRWSRSRGCWR